MKPPGLLTHLKEALFPLRQNIRGAISGNRNKGKPIVDRFGAILSVLYEDTERGVFILNSGGETRPASLGRVFELNPALWADDAVAGVFERLLRIELPSKSTIAATLYASPQIESTLADYVNARRRPLKDLSSEAQDILQAMALNRAAMFRAIAQGKDAKRSAFAARHFRVWISVTSAIGEVAVLDPESDAFAQFIRATDAIASSLSAAGLLSHVWEAKDYVATTRELVNPQLARISKTRGASFDNGRALRDSVVEHATAIDVGRDAIDFATCSNATITPVRAVALGVAGYPQSITLNATAGLLGSLGRSASIITDPYLVTAVVEPTERSEDRTTVAMKLARVKQLEQTEIGAFLTDLQDRNRDLTLASRSCQDGDGLCRITHEIVVFADKKKSAGAEEAAKALLSQAGLEAELDSGLQMMGYLLCLPMEAGAALMADARTARHTSTKTRESASHMLPVLGDFKSSLPRPGETTPTPMVLLTTRGGELVGVDLFANRNGNNNAIVAANSGAGKSVFVEDIVLAMLSTGGRVWVFDIGKSYQHCADLVAGQWLEFDEKDELCLNPLDVKGDALSLIDEISEIVVALANGDVPMEITALEKMKGALERVLTRGKDAAMPPTLTDLVAELMAENDPELFNLSVRLRPYAAGGRFARWFEGRNTVNFQSPLVVLEMQSLSAKPVLQNAVLLILIMTIVSEIKRLPRSQKKLIVIDEAWRLLTGNAGAFIEWACRTLRKYGAGIICISQSMEDFERGSAARAVRANADNVFLLRQKTSSIDRYTTDPYTRELISGLTTEAGVFSEMYVKLGDRPGVVARLMLDRFTMTAFSTRSDVFDAVEKEKATGKTTREAIAAVAASSRGEGR